MTVISLEILENVEHCGGKPEQADRILITRMSDVTDSRFNVQCKLTQWIPH